jgi:hypothetical protein
MGEKRVRFSIDGQEGSERVLSATEFRQYVANLSDAAKARLKVEGKHDAVYTNTEGELVRETLGGDQIMARAGLGEDALIDGAQDPKLQAFNRQQAERARKETAAEEGVLATFNAINPMRLTGIPQALESAAMGEEQAIQAQNEVAGANQGETLFGSMALGFGAGGAAMGALKGVGVGAKAGKGLGLAAHVAVDEAAFETALYTKYVMDQRQDFQAEELGQNIVAGLMFATPVVGGALLRKPLWKAAGMAGGGISTLAGHGRNAMVMKGLAAGGAAQGQYHRRAAQLGVVERLFRGRKTVTKVDELAELRKTMAKEEVAIGRATPEGLRSAKGGKADEILDHVRKNMDQKAGYLDGIDVNGMAKDLGGVRTATRQASNAVYRTARSMKVSQPIGIGRLGKSQTKRLEAAMDNFLGYADDLGFADELGHLRDVASAGEYGRIFQARLDMALKGKVGNRATAQLDDTLRQLSEDTSLWGTGKALEQAKNLNRGIDRLADGFEQLRKMDIPDDLSKIPEGTDLNQLDKAIAEIRGGLDHLHASKLLSFEQLRGITNTLDKVEDSLVTGKKAYVDAVKLNKARNSAAKNHKARFERVRSGDVETAGALEARMEARVAETAAKMQGVKNALKKVIEDGRVPVYTNRMLKVLRESSVDEKRELFMTMQEKIPMLVGNPEYMAKELEPFLAESPTNPEVHAMAGVNTGNTVYFLANKLGRVDRTLYGKARPPSREKAVRFAETFAAMMEPVEVAYAAVTGEVTQDMIDAVRVTSPAMYTELSVLLSEAIAEMDPITTPRATYKGISKFLGGADPLNSGEVIMQLQSNYAQNEQQAQATGISGQFNQDHPQDGDNAFTFTQRLQSY